MSKRILAMLLAVLTTVCLFAGCAGNATSSTGSAAPVSEAPSSEETSEPAKISISYIRDANAPVNPAEWEPCIELAKDCNAEITWYEWGVTAEEYLTKLNLAITGGDAPDIFFSPNHDDTAGYIEDGLLLCIDDYLDKYPNIAKYNDNDETRFALDYDGNQTLYSICGRYSEPFYWYGILARTDVIKDIGYEYDGTIDSFTGLLRAIKKETGKAPFTLRSGVFGLYQTFATSFGLDVEAEFYDDETEQYVIASIDDRLYKLLVYLNTLWNEGLIDPEYSLNTTAMWEEKMTTSQAFVCLDYFVRCEGVTNPVREKDPNSKFEMGAIALPVTEDGYKPYMWSNGTVASNDQWCISADTEHPETCLSILDTVLSEKYNLWNNYGIEGETYTMVDGKPTYTDDVPTALNDFKGDNKADNWRADRVQLFGMITDTTAYELAAYGKYSYPGAMMYKENGWLAPIPFSIPKKYFGEGEQQAATDAKTLLNDYFTLQFQDFVEGKRPLTKEEYAKFQQEMLNEYDGQKWMDIMNKAYKAWKG